MQHEHLDAAKKYGVPCPTLLCRLTEMEQGIETLSLIARSPSSDKDQALEFIHATLWEHVRAVIVCVEQAGFDAVCPAVYSD